jgi:hypothetical protein
MAFVDSRPVAKPLGEVIDGECGSACSGGHRLKRFLHHDSVILIRHAGDCVMRE